MLECRWCINCDNNSLKNDILFYAALSIIMLIGKSSLEIVL